MGSAKTMLKGGIVFRNDKTTVAAKPAKNNTIFNLLEEKE